MSSGVTLSSATRANLLSLQDTASLVSTTQNRLSTGKKVNSAIDNASNFFTAAGLSSRSSALSTLLDGISNGIQTIQAASKGIDGIQKLTAQLKSTAQQALASSNSFTSKASSFATLAGAVSDNLLSSGGTVATSNSAIGSSSTAVAATGTGSAAYSDGIANETSSGFATLTAANASFSINGTTVALASGDTQANVISKINAVTGTTGVTASISGGEIKLAGSNSGGQITLANVTGTGFTAGATTNGAGSSTQSLTLNGTTISYATGSTEAQVIAAVNAQTANTGVTASDSSGSLVLTGAATVPRSRLRAAAPMPASPRR